MIYTRDHCHCTFRRKLHGFMVKYRDSEHSSPLLSAALPSFSLFSHIVFSLFLSSIRTLFICLSFSTSVSILPFLLPPSCFISFHFSLLHRPVYLHPLLLFHPSSFRVRYHLFLQLDEDNVRAIFASLTRTLRFPTRDHRMTAHRAFFSSCFAKRTRSAWMEFYVGYIRKNATTSGMNLDYGNAR